MKHFEQQTYNFIVFKWIHWNVTETTACWSTLCLCSICSTAKHWNEKFLVPAVYYYYYVILAKWKWKNKSNRFQWKHFYSTICFHSCISFCRRCSHAFHLPQFQFESNWMILLLLLFSPHSTIKFIHNFPLLAILCDDILIDSHFFVCEKCIAFHLWCIRSGSGSAFRNKGRRLMGIRLMANSFQFQILKENLSTIR